MTAPMESRLAEQRHAPPFELELKDLDVNQKDPLGHGAFCVVYKAHFKHENDTDEGSGTSKKTFYALKKLKTGVRKAEMARTQLVQEGELLASLTHNNIIFLMGIGFDFESNSPFLLMELLAGTLDRYTHKWHMKSKAYFAPQFTPRDQVRARLRQIALGVGNGLAYMHSQNIVFRDVQPSNIGFTTSGQVKLFDCGLAVKLWPPHFKCAQQAGTVRYLAPEIARGKAYDTKVDVYSFAVLLWQLITGRLPFERELGADESYRVAAKVGFLDPDKRPPLQFVESEELQVVLQELWHPFPFKRPSMEEATAVLNQFLGPTALETEPTIFKVHSKSPRTAKVPTKRPGRNRDPPRFAWWSA